MTPREPNVAFEFVVSQLQANPQASFAEIRDAGKTQGFEIFPIVYGRAKALLGLVPTAKRGEGKRAKAVAAAHGSEVVPKRGPGRPRKIPTEPTEPMIRRGPGRPPMNPRANGPDGASRRPSGGGGGTGNLTDGWVEQIQSVVRERDQMANVLRQIRDLIEGLEL